MKNTLTQLRTFPKKLWIYFKSTKLHFYDIICAIASSFILASFITAVKINDTSSLDALKKIDPKSMILITLITAVALIAVSAIFKNNAPINASLILFSCGFAVAVGVIGDGEFALIICMLIVLMMIMRYIKTHGGININIAVSLSDKQGLIISISMFALFSVFIGVFSQMTYKSFTSNTFDFGIFAQMFEQMRRTGLPITTVERAKELSHFAVHFSPFYYLLLPGYMLFPTPIYLFFVQAAGVGAGIVAVYKIARALEFSPNHSVVFAALYALFPSMSYGLFWDFHENKFLSVLILWCIYFIIKEKLIPASIFALLTLSVKEDAVIYIAAIAIWMLFARKKKLFGASMLAFSVLYFFFATKMIAHFGGEPMMSRFGNLVPRGEDASLTNIFKTIVLDFGYFISQIFTSKKFEFIVLMLIPSLFVMITHGKSSTLLLLIPMLLENLMSNWPYQYNVYYQYTYGSAAIIIFATMLSLKDMDTEKLKDRLKIMLVFSLVITSILLAPKLARMSYYSSDKESYQKAEALIDKHRDELVDSDVFVSSYLMPHFYFVNEVYQYPMTHGEFKKTEYLIVDTRFKDIREKSAELMGDDYYLYDSDAFIQIYKIKDTSK